MRRTTDNTFVRGVRGTVDWAVTRNGKMPAREFFLTLSEDDQSKIFALFDQIANGQLLHRKRCKKLTDSDLFEVRDGHQLRFLGVFKDGGGFVIALGMRKKQDKIDSGDMKKANRILKEHFDR